MYRWVKFYVSRSQFFLSFAFLFSVCLSSSVDGLENQMCVATGQVIRVRRKWPVEKSQHGKDWRISWESRMVSGIKVGQNKPRNIQNLHRCQWDKSPLMASDMEAYAFWHLTQHRLGAYTRTGGRVWVGARTPPLKQSIVPPSYAIIFGLRPISTWEQCKLFKTRFQASQL